MRLTGPRQRRSPPAASTGHETARAARWLARRARRFRAEEDGSLIVFGIYVFLIILIFGGVGIDLMRFERDRADLQYTMDRAVLAAADLDQTLDPEAVVRDYLDKAGMSDYLSSVTVDDGVGFRSVSASASSEIRTQFMHMTGVDTLTAPAASTAEESIDGVEISLVLDMSGSMNSNSRLTRLKPAAREFVETVLASSESGNVSVSIIPYATQVGVGEALLSKYTVSNEHNYSHCVNFIEDEFSKTDLSTTIELERTAHFDPWTYSELSRDGGLSSPVCPVEDNLQILPLSNDKSELFAYIDGLSAAGNTSIDIGVKWGTVLLDPSTQEVVTSLIDDGLIDPAFEGRPYVYNNGTTLKILVLMTDGENTEQYMLNPSLRDGDSDVWYNAEADRYSVQRSEGGKTEYWWPTDETWNDHPYGNGEEPEYECEWSWYGTCYSWSATGETVPEPGEAVRLSYPELWNRTSLAWNTRYNYGFQGNRWTEWYYNAFTSHNGTAKDQHTRQICSKAKDAGIVVFTVGFEAPRSGQRLLEKCASSASHHFDVEGLEISEAFASIASSISKLRLTQ